MFHTHITTKQLEAAGIKYDIALPQILFDDILVATNGKNPSGHIVHMFQKEGFCHGELQAITPEGVDILDQLENWFYTASGFHGATQKIRF